MQMQVAGVAKAAIRRSAKAEGKATITRRGHKLSVAVNGKTNHETNSITALTDTITVDSSGFACLVECTWYQRREWYPDEHPIVSLHRARETAEWAMNHARRRARGRRQRRW